MSVEATTIRWWILKVQTAPWPAAPPPVEATTIRWWILKDRGRIVFGVALWLKQRRSDGGY